MDASESVLAVHQNHNYGYHPAGKTGVWTDELARRNYELAGGSSSDQDSAGGGMGHGDGLDTAVAQGGGVGEEFTITPSKRKDTTESQR